MVTQLSEASQQSSCSTLQKLLKVNKLLFTGAQLSQGWTIPGMQIKTDWDHFISGFVLLRSCIYMVQSPHELLWEKITWKSKVNLDLVNSTWDKSLSLLNCQGRAGGSKFIFFKEQTHAELLNIRQACGHQLDDHASVEQFYYGSIFCRTTYTCSAEMLPCKGAFQLANVQSSCSVFSACTCYLCAWGWNELNTIEDPHLNTDMDIDYHGNGRGFKTFRSSLI